MIHTNTHKRIAHHCCMRFVSIDRRLHLWKRGNSSMPMCQLHISCVSRDDKTISSDGTITVQLCGSKNFASSFWHTIERLKARHSAASPSCMTYEHALLQQFEGSPIHEHLSDQNSIRKLMQGCNPTKIKALLWVKNLVRKHQRTRVTIVETTQLVHEFNWFYWMYMCVHADVQLCKIHGIFCSAMNRKLWFWLWKSTNETWIIVPYQKHLCVNSPFRGCPFTITTRCDGEN